VRLRQTDPTDDTGQYAREFRRIDFRPREWERVMLDLLVSYWIWLISALVAGGLAGYWSTRPQIARGRWAPGWLGWAALAIGAVVVILQWGQAGLYIEVLLFLSFWCIVGFLAGTWLRKARTRTQAAVVRAAADERRAAEVKAVEDGRRAVEAKAAEGARRAAELKAVEDARRAVEAKVAEGAPRAAELKAAEDARRAAEAKAAEEAHRAAEAKAAERAHRAAKAMATKEARRAAEAKAAEEARHSAEVKGAKEKRRVAKAKTVEEGRRVAKAEADEEVRSAAAFHPSKGPKGTAALQAGITGDLRLIKGIEPKPRTRAASQKRTAPKIRAR
jgi:hypothetical protein